jgi:hypothetical protein
MVWFAGGLKFQAAPNFSQIKTFGKSKDRETTNQLTESCLLLGRRTLQGHIGPSSSNLDDSFSV